MISVMRTLPLLVGMLYLHFEALGNRVAVREQGGGGGGGGGVAIRERGVGGGGAVQKNEPVASPFFPP